MTTIEQFRNDITIHRLRASLQRRNMTFRYLAWSGLIFFCLMAWTGVVYWALQLWPA
jgi:hypothetical protein